jgi:hypothetical protein
MSGGDVVESVEHGLKLYEVLVPAAEAVELAHGLPNDSLADVLGSHGIVDLLVPLGSVGRLDVDERRPRVGLTLIAVTEHPD